MLLATLGVLSLLATVARAGESEPNGTQATADAVGSNLLFRGQIDASTDADVDVPRAGRASPPPRMAPST